MSDNKRGCDRDRADRRKGVREDSNSEISRTKAGKKSIFIFLFQKWERAVTIGYLREIEK